MGFPEENGVDVQAGALEAGEDGEEIAGGAMDAASGMAQVVADKENAGGGVMPVVPGGDDRARIGLIMHGGSVAKSFCSRNPDL